jgi:tetratricopeptide (TPR) repeat protein
VIAAATVVLAAAITIPAVTLLWRNAQNSADVAQLALDMAVEAFAASEQQDLAETKATIAEVIAKLDQLSTASPVSVISMRESVAQFCTRLGENKTAYQQRLAALQLAERHYDLTAPERLDALKKCAGSATACGEHAAAIEYASIRFGLLRNDASQTDLHYVDAVGGLATTYERAGDLVSAEKYHRESLAALEHIHSQEAEELLPGILKNFAEFLHVSCGKDEEADVLQREAIERFRQMHGDAKQEWLAHFLNSRASLLRDMDRLPEAEKLAREALAIRSAAYGPDHWHRFYRYVSAGLLGNILALQEQFEEAETLLLEAYAGLKQHPFPEMRRWQRETAERLQDMYENWDAVDPGQGHDERAAEWCERAAVSADP